MYFQFCFLIIQMVIIQNIRYSKISYILCHPVLPTCFPRCSVHIQVGMYVYLPLYTNNSMLSSLTCLTLVSQATYNDSAVGLYKHIKTFLKRSLNCMCICVCLMYEWVQCLCRSPRWSEEDIRSPGTTVVSQHVDVGTEHGSSARALYS